jgi:hypothetical protein
MPRELAPRRLYADQWDDVVRLGAETFAIEFKSRSDSATVASALLQIQQRRPELPENVHPLLVVPFMTKAGRTRCELVGQQWFDLAGNAHLVLPGIRIIISGEGKPPVRRGRPSSVFAPKSSRVAHYLLLDPEHVCTQREIALATRLGEGFVSQILQRLEELGFVDRKRREVRLSYPGLLLDEWRDEHRFPNSKALKGVVPARSGQETLQQLSQALRKARIDHAFTGLSAAWKLDPFADFRLVSCYVLAPGAEYVLADLGFIATEKGANLWLVSDADEGVLLGRREIDDVLVVSPVLAYVDLKAHPERSAEAAQHLKQHLLPWSAEVER